MAKSKKGSKNQPEPQGKRQGGFSLIELLVVVAIILVIAAIAIPSLLHAQWAARQTAAVGFIDAIGKANSMYESKYSNGYSPDIATLAGDPTLTPSCDHAQNLDQSLVATMPNSKQYTIAYTPEGAALGSKPIACTNAGYPGFLVTAVPLTAGAANGYCMDEKFTKHVDTTGSTTPVASEAACDALPVQ